MLALACPICRKPLHTDSLTCEHDHAFHQQDGVLSLLTPQFAAQLDAFAKFFQADRIAQHYPTLPPSAYTQLPFGDSVRNDPEWRARQIDLSLILKLLPAGKASRVLDVGAWNGWLSHQLAQRGHDVTAISYFADAQDGLGARQFYPNATWRAVQMDECELELIRDEFDLVVLNRCVQFSPSPCAQVRQAQARVAKSGQLVMTGLAFYNDARAHMARIHQRQHAFKAQHGIDLFLRPTRGYLDDHDRQQFAALGLQLRTHFAYWLGNIKAWLMPSRASLCYATWSNAA
ncbi:MAG: methyltransferase domain-containing protein [Anaerolineae bacterium]|nr:methyltransferase domain-containing protein [Anaerolineae bacterium]